ncbi:hypothetical protein E1B28_009381 [Marasmius oreades]|uniref:Uncharacterized protein n=1 Tax=Marasmius oreades TaxID=181124 RepID=A0A9P7UV96_9AGAR|nr:uncharacterized protein E1B28_009381 [Marasmius oreades]KAG7093094.1 hypothetical protein E1B28_009381 [Marasmius oreades]
MGQKPPSLPCQIIYGSSSSKQRLPPLLPAFHIPYEGRDVMFDLPRDGHFGWLGFNLFHDETLRCTSQVSCSISIKASQFSRYSVLPGNVLRVVGFTSIDSMVSLEPKNFVSKTSHQAFS